MTVFAAASLRGPLDDALEAWGGEARVSYAGSSALARQIMVGAPADLFVSASVAWMDEVERAGLILDDTRRDFLGNRLVLVGPSGDSAGPIEPLTGNDVLAIVGPARVATALVDAVPAGIYAKAALSSLGIWDEVAGQIVETDNVRSALALVSRSEAPFGLVYATDARFAPELSVRGVFAPESHGSIVYPAAVVAAGAEHDAARALLTFLSGAEAAKIFADAGFVPLN
ncbi:MAG: molybdate ABC transporter substrate-binding protein [Pseudomonadota bacterium]